MSDETTGRLGESMTLEEFAYPDGSVGARIYYSPRQFSPVKRLSCILKGDGVNLIIATYAALRKIEPNAGTAFLIGVSMTMTHISKTGDIPLVMP